MKLTSEPQYTIMHIGEKDGEDEYDEIAFVKDHVKDKEFILYDEVMDSEAENSEDIDEITHFSNNVECFC